MKEDVGSLQLEQPQRSVSVSQHPSRFLEVPKASPDREECQKASRERMIGESLQGHRAQRKMKIPARRNFLRIVTYTVPVIVSQTSQHIAEVGREEV